MTTKRLTKEQLQQIAEKYRKLTEHERAQIVLKLGKARLPEFMEIAESSWIPVDLWSSFCSAADTYQRALAAVPGNLLELQRRQVSSQLYAEFIKKDVVPDPLKEPAVLYLAAVLSVKRLLQALNDPSSDTYKELLLSAVTYVGWFALDEQYVREIGIEDGLQGVVNLVERIFSHSRQD